jgi:hypothetical protein
MRDVIRILFGREEGILSELFGGDEADGFGMADRARRAGEWCGTTPGSRSGAGRPGRAGAPRGVPRQIADREFRVF